MNQIFEPPKIILVDFFECQPIGYADSVRLFKVSNVDTELVYFEK